MTGILTTREELAEVISDLLPGAIEKAKLAKPEHLFTIAETARKLGKSYDTIKRMIDQNRIQATADRKYISQQAITNYLTGKL